MISYEQIKNNEEIRTDIRAADESLCALGFTEHNLAHVTRVATVAGDLLSRLGYDEHTVTLAKIAAHMHDIGNLINRVDHSQSGAIMTFRILDRMGMPPADIAAICTAIGNHDEGTGVPVNEISAALILADKCDVRKTRVRNDDEKGFDIHDRVNYSVQNATLDLNEQAREITLSLTIDTAYSSVVDYFEIFLERMLLCRRAAEKLSLAFRLNVNGQTLL